MREESKLDSYIDKASAYLRTLCDFKPNRRTGSSGNREATNFFEKTIREFGYNMDSTSFETLDYVCNNATLIHGDDNFEVFASPYSLGCDITEEIIAISTVEELEYINCEGKILLLSGTICDEQIMPKNFVFYNPEHHKRIISILEDSRPGGIITATKKNTDQVGALNPFPLFLDGDFDIPSVYCEDVLTDVLTNLSGNKVQLKIVANRIPSNSVNVIASLNRDKAKKIVITAHIDTYESTPGALDNASGVAVLLLVAEMLADYKGEDCLEIIALNGEDHYSAAGQMDYLKRYGNEMKRILLAINIDNVGYKMGKSSYSFYECKRGFEERVEKEFLRFGGLIRGEQWYNGDHMIFVQNQISSIAITSEFTPELMKTITHTLADTPDLIDCQKLVEISRALNEAVRKL